MFCRPVSRYSPWFCDENDRLVLLKVPEQVDLNAKPVPSSLSVSLSTLDRPDRPSRPAPTLPNLPAEIHYTIIHHLAPVDRVCLALVCRRICASVLASPRLTPETWYQFARLRVSPSQRYVSQIPHSTCLVPGPECHQLPQRLAHGWVDKKRWRYCWKCHKILPREERWWWDRDAEGNRRIQGRRNPHWSVRTGVPQDEWRTWRKSKKLKWMVHVWCNAGWEDSSIIGCQWCRQRACRGDGIEGLSVETEDQKMATKFGWVTGALKGGRDKDKDEATPSFVGYIHPVQCPGCLERELTFTWMPPARVRVRNTLRRACGKLHRCCFALLWCLETALIALVIAVMQPFEWTFVRAWRRWRVWRARRV